jgi:hypothetical protein
MLRGNSRGFSRRRSREMVVVRVKLFGNDFENRGRCRHASVDFCAGA